MEYVELLFTMPAAPIAVAILVRVSTRKQDTDRQVCELEAVATARGWTVAEVCKEQVSGASNAEERAGLLRIRELVQAGTVRKVLVHEVSRLARRNSVAHEFLEFLDGAGVSLYWHQQGIETLLPNGKRNPAASIMFSLLAEMARAERETIVERIHSGLEEAKRKGVRLGRPPGSKTAPADFLAKHRDIVRLLREGHSIRHAARITGKGISTVQRVKAALEAKAQP